VIPTDLAGVVQEVSTGALPGWDRTDVLVREAHRRHAGDRAGAVADYIPILGAVDPDLFGVAVVDITGSPRRR
jgi:glutaminase